MTITVDDAIERLTLMSEGYNKAKQAEAMRMGAAALKRLKEIEDWHDRSLSQRLRAGVECAQWVIDAVVQLELKATSVEIPPSEADGGTT
jgi:hypothetical protein